jgi:hypothetical protein
MLREHAFPVRAFLNRPLMPPRPDALLGPLGSVERSELPYIYHHLRKGCILDVQPVMAANGTVLFFHVRYQGFRLGVLCRPLADRLSVLLAEGRPYRLTVSHLDREKYLPPTAVHVELEWGSGC